MHNGFDLDCLNGHNTGMSHANTAKPPNPQPNTPPTPAQVRKLRALAHHLRPVILLGAKGLTDEVGRETAGALEHHELIKVRSSADGKQARRAELQRLADTTESTLIQLIGRIGVLYRAGDPPTLLAGKSGTKPAE
jgi:RNA-binding protein